MLAERTSRSRIRRWTGCGALQAAYRSAVKARTAAIDQITSVLVAAPEPLQAKFRGLAGDRLVAVLLRCRGFYSHPIVADAMVALRLLAERHVRGHDRIHTGPGWQPHSPRFRHPGHPAGAPRGQDAAPHRTNDLDRAEHRHTITTGGTLYRA